MKVLKTIRILLGVLIFAGCNLKDDLSVCPPPYNMALRFHYEGDSGDPLLFGEKISCVSLFVFDNDGKLVKTEKAKKEDLGSDNSMTLFLAPGDYRIACWFNATDSYTIFEGNNISDCILKNPCSEYPEDPMDTDDPLYFGSADITVDDKEIVSEVINLSGAHIDIEVYVKGYKLPNGSTGNPVIEILGSIYNYGIMMDRLDNARRVYRPSVVYDPQKQAFRSDFNTLCFDDDNDLEILVKNPLLLKNDSDNVQRINVQQFMKDNNISVYRKNEAKVSILISFTNLGVTIGIPKWDEVEIDPSSN